MKRSIRVKLWLGVRSFAFATGFNLGANDDGVTADIPVAVLSTLSSERFDWLVPGLRLELITELIRSLPEASAQKRGAS
jgi:ATP-dependent helicase HrpA